MSLFKSDSADGHLNQQDAEAVSQDEEFPSAPFMDVCGMCGRTILTGEKTEHFIAPDDGRSVIVCSHCRAAAVNAGLRRGGTDGNR